MKYFVLCFALLTPIGIRADCKNTPVLTASYEGVGMVVSGEHLVLRVCRSGEIEFEDSGKGGWHTRKAVLSDHEMRSVLEFLDKSDIRELNGNYNSRTAKPGERLSTDHTEWVDVTVYRGNDKQQFSAIGFYQHGFQEYPPGLVSFLCRLSSLRQPEDTWKPFSNLPCESVR